MRNLGRIPPGVPRRSVPKKCMEKLLKLPEFVDLEVDAQLPRVYNEMRSAVEARLKVDASGRDEQPNLPLAAAPFDRANKYGVPHALFYGLSCDCSGPSPAWPAMAAEVASRYSNRNQAFGFRQGWCVLRHSRGFGRD